MPQLPKKKFQVFISSTFEDMREERRAAVLAILESGHIPSGMEQFAATGEGVPDTIKRWIDDSDVFLLLLGGRYGSISRGKESSYTEEEFDYAQEQKKQIIVMYIDPSFLEIKKGIIEERITVAKRKNQDVTDLSYFLNSYKENNSKYELFVEKATQSISVSFNSVPELKAKIIQSLTHNDNISQIATAWQRYEMPSFDCPEEIRKYLHQGIALETADDEIIYQKIKAVSKNSIRVIGAVSRTFFNNPLYIAQQLQRGVNIQVVLMNEDCIIDTGSTRSFSLDDKILINSEHFNQYYRPGYAQRAKNLQDIENLDAQLRQTADIKGQLEIYKVSYLPTVAMTLVDDRWIMVSFVLPFTQRKLFKFFDKIENDEIYFIIDKWWNDLKERGKKVFEYANK